MALYKEKLFLFVTQHNADVRVRFIGPQKEMFQYFPKDILSTGKRSTFKVRNNGNDAYHISLRIVSLVIDRSDDKIRAFVCPWSAWRQVERAGLEHDFNIRKIGTGLQTRYEVNTLEKTEPTNEQLAMVEATLNSYSFEHIFVDLKPWEILTEIEEEIDSRFDILDL